MRRLPTLIGSVYACPKCDTDDPMKSPEVAKLLASELCPRDGIDGMK
jgi:hypothetical protein